MTGTGKEKIVTYTGFRSSRIGAVVRKNRTILSPMASRKIRDHSPDGFEWGYGGSGPSQLALALLLDVTGDPVIALSHYQRFKFSIVGGWGDRWEITNLEIRSWIEKSDEERDEK